MNLAGRDLVEWGWYTPLTNGQNLVVPLGGGEGLPFGVARGQDYRFLTFGVYSSHTFDLIVETSWQGGFAAGATYEICNLGILAATYTQPFALPAPQGDNGFIVVQGYYLRIRAVDTAGAGHTQTSIYVAAWW